MKTRRFATHGSDAFNDWMEEQVALIGRDVEAALGGNLVALVLSGGYARGEGGVVETGAGERPYNDVDFVLIVRRRVAGISEALEPVSRRYGAVLGIDVDFSRPLTEDDIRRWPHWLMWTDVARAHRVIVGPEDIISGRAPAYLQQSPPLIEATRLLLNRGAGLLWSRRILAGLQQPHDPDFVRRNMHKAELAIGDAVILAHKRHQAPYTGRLPLLKSLLAGDEKARAFINPAAYEAALEFRLRPGSPDGVQPGAEALEATVQRWKAAFLYTEQQRTGRDFSTLPDYEAWNGLREPALHGVGGRVRNLVRNARMGRLSTLYPREALFRTLPRLLDARGHDWPRESAAFLAMWQRYN